MKNLAYALITFFLSPVAATAAFVIVLCMFLIAVGHFLWCAITDSENLIVNSHKDHNETT